MDNRDICLAMNELVNAVYEYSFIDPDWNAPATKIAQQASGRMDQCAQRLAVKLIGRPFSREELDLIFDWER